MSSMRIAIKLSLQEEQARILHEQEIKPSKKRKAENPLKRITKKSKLEKKLAKKHDEVVSKIIKTEQELKQAEAELDTIRNQTFHARREDPRSRALRLKAISDAIITLPTGVSLAEAIQQQLAKDADAKAESSSPSFR